MAVARRRALTGAAHGERGCICVLASDAAGRPRAGAAPRPGRRQPAPPACDNRPRRARASGPPAQAGEGIKLHRRKRGKEACDAQH